MKKTLTILVAAAVGLSLVACSSQPKATEPANVEAASTPQMTPDMTTYADLQEDHTSDEATVEFAEPAEPTKVEKKQKKKGKKKKKKTKKTT